MIFYLFFSLLWSPKLQKGEGDKALSAPQPPSSKQGLCLMACPSILSSVKVANSQKEISIASHFQKKWTKSLTVYQFFPNRLKDCDSCIFENGTKIKIWNLATFNSISSFFVIFLIILCSNYTWRIWGISRKNHNFWNMGCTWYIGRNRKWCIRFFLKQFFLEKPTASFFFL